MLRKSHLQTLGIQEQEDRTPHPFPPTLPILAISPAWINEHHPCTAEEMKEHEKHTLGGGGGKVGKVGRASQEQNP